MSFYNLLHGYNPQTPFILALISIPPGDFPRFRDAFIGKLTNSATKDLFGIPLKQTSDEPVVSVYTRSGGGNRPDYVTEIQKLQANPLYLEDYDDSFDSTYMTFVFRIPEDFLEDLKCLDAGLDDFSERYIAEVSKFFPRST
jgi:hypothetical protein